MKLESSYTGPSNKRSGFETFIEILGWIRIVISPLLFGLIIGAVIYFSRSNILTLIIGIVISLIGLIIGIVWANKVWKRKGTMEYMSRIMATPELDKSDDQK